MSPALWKWQKKIPYYMMPLPNFSLKTLAEALCNISEVDKASKVATGDSDLD